MKRIFKSNRLKRWNTGSGSQRWFLKRSSLSSYTFWGQTVEECHFLIVIFTASGLSVFCTPLQVFSCLASSVIFWATMFESIFGRLHAEQHCPFRDLVIRPWGLLQVPPLLNDNSLLKTFLQRSIIWLHAIVMSLYHSYVVTFYIWSLYFVYDLCILFTGKTKKKKFIYNLIHFRQMLSFYTPENIDQTLSYIFMENWPKIG